MKRIVKIVGIIIFYFALCGNVSIADAATFDDINQSSVFLNQQGRSTCTLVSSAMMMRRAAILQGNGNWSSITESSLKGSAWASGAGLKWSFSYAGISVGSAKLPTGAANKNILINLLAEHPEGIVLHYKGAPHAVLLTDYTDGIFYCSDPLPSRPTERIPLSRAYKVTIQNATRYWYVTSPKCYISEVARVSEPTGYNISINNTLFTIKQNISVTINPYENNVDNYTFVILKNGLWYKTIDNGSSNTLNYNIKEAGNYQVYGIIRNQGGTFSGAIDNGGLSFEVTDQILTGFNFGTNADESGFDASKGITFDIFVHNNIEVTDYKYEIYKKVDSKYEYYTTVDNGLSSTYHFQEPAGEYRVKIIVSNRVSQVSNEVYLKAVSYSVLGVSIDYDKDEFKNFVFGKIKNMRLKANVEPDNALNKKVTWKSSDLDVIKIDNNGNIQCVGNGFSLITVCTQDGSYIDSIPIKINSLGIIYGDVSGDGAITVTDVAELVNYIHSNDRELSDIQKKVMDLDGNGIVDSYDQELSINYLLDVNYIFPVESMINNISINQLPYKTQYNVGEKIDLSGLKLNVQYNSGKNAIVSDNYTYSGNTNSVGKQKVTVSYCEDDITKQVSFDINVIKSQQKVSGTKEYKKTYGDDDFYLDTRLIEGDGKASYTSSDNKVAEVDKNGKVKIKAAGSTIIKVNYSETKKYEGAIYEVKVNVDKKVQTISGTSIYRKNTDDSQFNLDVLVSEGDGKLTYRVSDDSIAKVNLDGKVQILKEGKVLILVTVSETKNYKEGEFTVVLEIVKKENENKPTSSPDVKSTSVPKFTQTPEIITTLKPEITDEPDIDILPENTTMPQKTQSPSRTKKPEATAIPAKTIDPQKTETPIKEQPHATVTPFSLKRKGDKLTDSFTKNNYIIKKSGQIVNENVIGAEVEFVGNKSKSSKIVIPDNVTIGNIKYSVVSVKGGALKNNQKVARLVVGKNVSIIGKQAFYKCKKIKNIIIKTSKLTEKNVRKDAFAKINAKVIVKVPKKKLKEYKNILSKKGILKGAKYKY